MKTNGLLARATVSWVSILLCSCLWAQPLELPELSGEIVLDGLSDEAAWQAIAPLPLTMYQPVFGGSPSENTEIRVAYDDRYLYASARFYDANPDSIHVHSLYRDQSVNDDLFYLIVDTFNDKENALGFWTTPAGIRGDFALSEDGARVNEHWDTFWTAEAVQNEQGWFAEMRIPFSSLGFDRRSDLVTFGLISYRFIDRKNEILHFPGYSQNHQPDKVSLAKEVTLKGISTEKPIYITPYVLAGEHKNVAGDHQTHQNTNEREIGLDIKYNLSNNMTLDATINTDFAQVEADDEVVNLSRYSVFFPEKRRFFQERSSIFDFGTGGIYSNDRMFYSRRIGLQDGGVVPILGGVRLVGRKGPWDLGAFDMQTDDHNGAPSENFGVLRLRRQEINENSYLGGMVNRRAQNGGGRNLAYGIDGIFKMFNQEYLSVRWAQTRDSEVENSDFWEKSSASIIWERRTRIGWNYEGSIAYAGSDYQPDMGYVRRHDFTEYSWRLHYDTYTEQSPRLKKYSLFQFLGSASFRNADQSLESGWAEWGTDCVWKSGAYVWADLEVYGDDLTEPLALPEDAEVPVGDYVAYRFEGGMQTPPGKLFKLNVYWSLGDFFDGTNQTIGLTPTWSLNKHLRLSVDYNLNSVRFPSRDQGFDAHVAKLRLESAANRHFSVNSFVQYNSITEELTPNLRFRYNFREGTDLWLVYNEGFDLDRDHSAPFSPSSLSRSMMLKFTMTLATSL